MIIIIIIFCFGFLVAVFDDDVVGVDSVLLISMMLDVMKFMCHLLWLWFVSDNFFPGDLVVQLRLIYVIVLMCTINAQTYLFYIYHAMYI